MYPNNIRSISFRYKDTSQIDDLYNFMATPTHKYWNVAFHKNSQFHNKLRFHSFGCMICIQELKK